MNINKVSKFTCAIFLLATIPFFQNCSSGGGGGGGGAPTDSGGGNNSGGTGNAEAGYTISNSSVVSWFYQPDKTAFANDPTKSGFYYGLAFDKSDDIYAVGSTNIPLDGNAVVGSYDGLITKFNSSRKKLWTKTLGKTGKTTAFQKGIVNQKSNDLIVVGSTNADYNGVTNGLSDCLVASFDESGIQKWILQFGVTSVYSDGKCVAYGVVLGSNDDIFLVATVYGGGAGNSNTWSIAGLSNQPGSTNIHLLVAKVSPAGSLIAAYLTGGPSSDLYAHLTPAIAYNTLTDEVYASSAIRRPNGSNIIYYNDSIVTKLSPALVPSWEVRHQAGGQTYTLTTNTIAIDPSGNPWIGGFSDTDVGGFANSKKDLFIRTENGFIAKLEPAHGSIVDVKYMVNSTLSSTPESPYKTIVNSLVFDASGALHIAGSSSELNGNPLITETVFYKTMDSSGNFVKQLQEETACIFSPYLGMTNLIAGVGGAFIGGYVNSACSNLYGVSVPASNGYLLKFK